MTKQKKTAEEIPEKERPSMYGETVSMSLRLPSWVVEEHEGDWNEFREVLDAWATAGDELDPPEIEKLKGVCMRINVDTLQELETEAKRLSKVTGRRWTAGKVARLVYERHHEAQ